MITCKDFEKKQASGDVRLCLLLADETPDTFPTTGEGVAGLPDDVTLDSGSVMLCLDTSKKHILGNTGTWCEWKA